MKVPSLVMEPYTSSHYSQLQVELESQNVCVSVYVSVYLSVREGILHIDEFDDYTVWSGMWVGGWSGVVVGRVEGHPWSSGGALEHRGAPSEISKETLIKVKRR